MSAASGPHCNLTASEMRFHLAELSDYECFLDYPISN